jgi:UDP-N-acetylglucosamine 1-carboxyvinyltransferase
MEPHVVDTYLFLEKLWVKIEWKKSHNLKISWKKDFDLDVKHTICWDYIEAWTFAIAAVATESNLKIKWIKEEDLDSFWVKMKEMWVKFKHFENWTEIFETKNLKPVNIKTSVFPWFPTDLQAPFSILQIKANWVSKIFETLFEKRFNYLFELEKMWAQIEFLNNH